MINSAEISVIVQGAVNKDYIYECLRGIRTHLPDAEIILSTWQGSEIQGLDFDRLVLSPDPGGTICDFKYNTINNVNRQLTSTQNGLKYASRPYCLKIRSDAIINGDEFINYWNKFPERNPYFKLFTNRVMLSTIYSRERSDQHGGGLPTPFHPSDLWFFGATSDILKYFEGTEPMTQMEMGNWSFKYPNRLPYQYNLWRYSPEQYFFLSYLRRHGGLEIQFDDWSDWSPINISLSKQLIYNNFIFLGMKQSQIFHPKHSWAALNDDQIIGLITYHLFQERYREYCDPLYTCSIINLEKNESLGESESLRESKNLGESESLGERLTADSITERKIKRRKKLLRKLRFNILRFLYPFTNSMVWISYVYRIIRDIAKLTVTRKIKI